jgi:hypothetical protein
LCGLAFACCYFRQFLNFFQIACTSIKPDRYLRWWYSFSRGEVGLKIKPVSAVVPPAGPILRLYALGPTRCSLSCTSCDPLLLSHAIRARRCSLHVLLVLLSPCVKRCLGMIENTSRKTVIGTDFKGVLVPVLATGTNETGLKLSSLWYRFLTNQY